MDTILKEWLEKQEAAQKAEKIKQREKILRKLGLVDRTKEKIKVHSSYSGMSGVYWNEVKHTYEGYPVIDVTDEEYELICKNAPKEEETVNKTHPHSTRDTVIDLSAENTLNTYAIIILVIGIIAFVIMLVAGVKTGGFLYFFGIGLSVLITSLLTWAVTKVFVNISTTLKQINKKIK